MENETDIKLESLTEEALTSLIKERDEAKSLAEKRDADLKGVVEELKTLRAKKEEAPKEPKSDGAPDVERIVAARFEEAERLQRAKALEDAHNRAKEKFLAEHTEFLPENDSSGIRRAALEKKLARFNLAVAQTEDDALGILSDAYDLLSKREQEPSSRGGTPPPAGSSSKYVGGSSLTAKELGVIQRLGWSREKYLETKLKHPDLVSQLFN